MKKFDNYIIEKSCDSNSDKLQKILIIESLVDDILQFSLRINNSVGEIFLLQPFQKKTIFIPCYFEEDIVKVKDDDEVEWNLLEFQKFRAFLA
ncbi:competence damage-inducible protein A [Streptococcus pneumoniae]|nr:competence damage-inducible protein A [Streptococcus pneumoniae]VLX13032.1 competence damage-inducible protein A [Streptococcus pneumoniae]VMY63670.1 competence damage-inducible protein A [Streptococcus pneumoniae]